MDHGDVIGKLKKKKKFKFWVLGWNSASFIEKAYIEI